MLLWGNAISQSGVRVGQVAVPLVAVTALGAGPVVVGLLTAANTVGLLVFGLPAGVWVDRARRRPLMVVMAVTTTMMTGPLLNLLHPHPVPPFTGIRHPTARRR